MSEQRVILERLLAKYEGSKHFTESGSSNRRVMLQVAKHNGKTDFPECDYEDASVRDAYNAAAQTLERDKLIAIEWKDNLPVMAALVLRLESAEQCYERIGRVHPKRWAERIAVLVENELQSVSAPWIADWRDSVVADARERHKVPAFCKTKDVLLRDLLHAFAVYDTLTEPVTMRAFSIRCYADSKYFERQVRKEFLHIACKYSTELAAACEETDLGEREQLALLGIYARPELYELSGQCRVHLHDSTVDVGGAGHFGLALPSTLVDEITAIDLQNINTITFIENKTNYDEYLLREQQPNELVFFHGGFISPQKRKLIEKLCRAAADTVKVRFWADIDLGGFRMFARLQQLAPNLQLLHMSAADVEQYHEYGLARTPAYLARLQMALDDNSYPLFEDVIRAILRYGVTIEQEIFLNTDKT